VHPPGGGGGGGGGGGKRKSLGKSRPKSAHVKHNGREKKRIILYGPLNRIWVLKPQREGAEAKKKNSVVSLARKSRGKPSLEAKNPDFRRAIEIDHKRIYRTRVRSDQKFDIEGEKRKKLRRKLYKGGPITL